MREKAQLIESYISRFGMPALNFEDLIDARVWAEYWAKLEALHEDMRDAQDMATAIKATLTARVDSDRLGQTDTVPK